jgi:histidyl-tRNA synthetase
VKAQLKYADKIGARYVIVLGDNELEKDEATLKRMSDGEQTPVALEAEAIKRNIQ